ncbi:MAG: sulfite exporter TauE/SafE family protein [Hyphomicrobiaceae bacterium]
MTNSGTTVLTDPWFYIVGGFAVLVVGLSKSGFLTGLGVLGVPILTFVMAPVQAAAILLPILIAMDVVGVWAYRQNWDRRNLLLLIPSAAIGIAIGWATAAYVTDAAVRLIVGSIGLIFAIDHWLRLRPAAGGRAGTLAGLFWGSLTGFVSFVSHAGSPPFQIYVMPQRLQPVVYAGTSTMLFAVVNLLKVGPYLALGQFDVENLKASLVLLPLAPAGVFLGLHLIKRIPSEPFYRLAYVLLLIVSIKLIVDGSIGSLWV